MFRQVKKYLLVFPDFRVDNFLWDYFLDCSLHYSRYNSCDDHLSRDFYYLNDRYYYLNYYFGNRNYHCFRTGCFRKDYLSYLNRVDFYCDEIRVKNLIHWYRIARMSGNSTSRKTHSILETPGS